MSRIDDNEEGISVKKDQREYDGDTSNRCVIRSSESIEETHRPLVPFMFKVDPPDDSPDDSAEDSTNEEMEGQSIENNSEESTSPTTDPPTKINCPFTLSSAKFGKQFGANDLSNSIAKPKAAILRPSQLGAVTSAPAASKIVLQPAKFQNPFTKVSDDSIVDDDGGGGGGGGGGGDGGGGEDSGSFDAQSKKKEVTKDSPKSEEKSEEDANVAKPKFLPLGVSTKDNESNVNNSVDPAGHASTPAFVFGQNLKERVTVSSDTEASENSEKEEKKSDETTNENGSSELLFSNAAAVCRNSTNRSGLTLTQAAQELEEANRANKRKYSQVALLTGEEGETNVLQINCKLFAFDKASSSWQERGRGTLRLNDRDEESRLVGRAAGTQRLILNTKVWPGMTAERAGPKSLRLTAMDIHGDIRIFIVQAAPKEIEQLHSLLLQRLKRAQERQPKKLATEH